MSVKDCLDTEPMHGKSQDESVSNIEKIFWFAFRRVQEIGIYDEGIDKLFEELHFIVCSN